MYQFIKGFVIHKWLVMWYIMGFCRRLLWRSLTHDMSKISKAERASFIALASNDALKKFAYNSDEYKAEIKKHKAIIDVHYKNNSHHPNHHEDGIRDMDLFDIIEMVCDWRAAGRRTKGGNLGCSFEANKDRYGIPHGLFMIMRRTFLQGGHTWHLPTPATSKEIIEMWLKENGYDGLYEDGECGCILGDIAPCWSVEAMLNCCPGYRQEAPEDSGFAFMVGAKRLVK